MICWTSSDYTGKKWTLSIVSIKTVHLRKYLTAKLRITLCGFQWQHPKSTDCLSMFGEEEVEISELRSTPCKRKAERRNSLRPLRRGRCCPLLRRKQERLRGTTREWETIGGRERDKGNTGLASTQFPSLASNFRRILPSHSILPLYQRVSLHLSQLSRPPFSIAIYIPGFPSRLAHGESRASPLVSPTASLSASVNASYQISGLEIEIHGIRVVAAHCNLVSKLKPGKYMRT